MESFRLHDRHWRSSRLSRPGTVFDLLGRGQRTQLGQGPAIGMFLNWWAGVVSVLNALPLPEELAGPEAGLTVDSGGRLHPGNDDALQDRASIKDLKTRLEDRIPRVDLSKQILEVMNLHLQFPAAFTSVIGGTSRLADLHVSVAALLTAHRSTSACPG